MEGDESHWLLAGAPQACMDWEGGMKEVSAEGKERSSGSELKSRLNLRLEMHVI